MIIIIILLLLFTYIYTHIYAYNISIYAESLCLLLPSTAPCPFWLAVWIEYFRHAAHHAVQSPVPPSKRQSTKLSCTFEYVKRRGLRRCCESLGSQALWWKKGRNADNLHECWPCLVETYTDSYTYTLLYKIKGVWYGCDCRSACWSCGASLSDICVMGPAGCLGPAWCFPVWATTKGWPSKELDCHHSEWALEQRWDAQGQISVDLPSQVRERTCCSRACWVGRHLAAGACMPRWRNLQLQYMFSSCSSWCQDVKNIGEHSAAKVIAKALSF